MAKAKKHATPSKATPATVPPASSSKSTPAAIPTLPLQHYLSVLPLQHAAIFFCLLQASRSKKGPTTPESSTATFLSKLSFKPIITSLVADPLGTLFISCLTISLVQAYFGSWARGVRRKSLGLDPEVERKEKRGFFGAFGEMRKTIAGGGKPTMPSRSANAKDKPTPVSLAYIGTAMLVTVAGAILLHAIAILLGAPLIKRAPETFLLSLLVSILAFLPIAIAIPPTFAETQERYIWLRLFSELSPTNDLEIVLFAPAIGALVGAWSGALPIPLDWDRPWQVWPTTPVVGALVGHLIGSVAGMALCLTKSARANDAITAIEGKKSN